MSPVTALYVESDGVNWNLSLLPTLTVNASVVTLSIVTHAPPTGSEIRGYVWLVLLLSLEHVNVNESVAICILSPLYIP